MIINCFYDECMEYADIVYLPNIKMDIEMLQEHFFEWMFDKKNNHKYWVTINSEKVYCKYGTQAFVEWLNQYIAYHSIEKAHIIEENATMWDENNECIIF